MKSNTKQLINHLHETEGCVPNIYLAGKIRKHCWRHGLVSGLRNHTWNDGELPQENFVYVGPFFVGCDHGCFHGESTHGVVATSESTACEGRDVLAEFNGHRLEITNLCLGAIVKADLLFCYIDSNDCFGTIFEIGYAFAHNVPIVIVFKPGIASETNNDFWFLCAKANWVVYNVDEWELPKYLMTAIRRYL